MLLIENTMVSNRSPSQNTEVQMSQMTGADLLSDCYSQGQLYSAVLSISGKGEASISLRMGHEPLE